jgi:hypothetical protein
LFALAAGRGSHSVVVDQQSVSDKDTRFAVPPKHEHGDIWLHEGTLLIPLHAFITAQVPLVLDHVQEPTSTARGLPFK